ncbi:ABC transporter permease [Mesorhizobium sp. M8A.F.Ca.ET.057.01.1.1]|uniref:ABC transporter permease n=1 Tax=Mesorhizobium sp. M8A.F.Ca.ET.057.01.1.1 TaxID=2493679 RepID=UPI003A87523C
MTLILTLTRREIAGRYRGSALGLLWSLLNPLFMLAVYTFVFGVVMKSRWITPITRAQWIRRVSLRSSCSAG